VDKDTSPTTKDIQVQRVTPPEPYNLGRPLCALGPLCLESHVRRDVNLATLEYRLCYKHLPSQQAQQAASPRPSRDRQRGQQHGAALLIPPRSVLVKHGAVSTV
jgi:hypothetical protein